MSTCEVQPVVCVGAERARVLNVINNNIVVRGGSKFCKIQAVHTIAAQHVEPKEA